MQWQSPPIPSVALHLTNALHAKLNSLTKPVGSLGQLENLAFRIGMMQGVTSPVITAPQVLIFAGDHGAALDGVSAYPQDVTWQMVDNFLSGGAAISVLSRANNLGLIVVDAGVNHDFEAHIFQRHTTHPQFINEKIAHGTKSFVHGAAMSRDEACAALAAGRKIAERVCSEGTNLIAFGEMGIGNTASASLLMHHFTGVPLVDCIGRGTGLDDVGLARKQALLARAVTHIKKDADVIDALAQYGGFEIAMMAGAMLGAATQRAVIVVDGFISSAALLVAAAIDRDVKDYAICAHLSDERGHALMLNALEVKPLLSLQMRLGEGTGAAIAIPIIIAATKLLSEMATFEAAEVSQAIALKEASNLDALN